jgi:chromosome segregation ATPase
MTSAVGDLDFDARLLAEYGEPPRHWLLSPLYAWRVLRRLRQLKAALAGRREEASRTAGEVEDALVAFAERVRPVAEKEPGFATAAEELHRAEELLRSRDRVLATEQDAQNARLVQVDARLAKLENELGQAQSEEQGLAAELSTAQGALGREEAKLKRAEVEVRAAQQRETAAGANGPDGAGGVSG